MKVCSILSPLFGETSNRRLSPRRIEHSWGFVILRWEMKEPDVTAAQFSSAILSIVGDDKELHEKLIEYFKLDGGEECQSRK